MLINSNPETLKRIKGIIHDIDELKYCLKTFSDNKPFEKENFINFLDDAKIKLLATLTELNMYNHINQDNLPETIIEISKTIDEFLEFPATLSSYKTLLMAVSNTLKNYGNKVISDNCIS